VRNALKDCSAAQFESAGVSKLWARDVADGQLAYNDEII